MLPTDREHGQARAGAVLDESPRRGSRLVTLLVAAFVLVAGAGLYLATVDVVVSARGRDRSLGKGPPHTGGRGRGWSAPFMSPTVNG
ncbi:MAG: hypothetical protein M5U09_17205 [Gammaproteobacteria bacterium]|nr:hypothetical protein [Gammaproteobacteria bacterium]